MKFNWQEIAEQHASRIRELEEIASDLQYALKLATGYESVVNYDLWKCWIHEKDCPGAIDGKEENCKCDGNYILDIVEGVLSKRI